MLRPMPSLVVDGDDLVVHMSWWERFWAFRAGDLRVPLSAIRAVDVPPNPWLALRGWRSTGVNVLGKASFGTRRHGTGRDFVAVRGSCDAVEVQLNDGAFERLLVSVAEPATTADAVADAAGIRRPSL